MNLKELSQTLGLSQTTVSRALNGYPEVAEETRQKVIETANRLGYRPNVSARTLATGRVGAIAIVIGIGEYTADFLNGVSSFLKTAGMDVLISQADDEAEEMDIYRRFAASRRVDAVLLHTPRPNDRRIALLQELGLPFVLHGRSEGASPHAYLDIDNEDAIFRSTRHLLDLGHRRIALINGVPELTFAIHRDRGYVRALAAANLAVNPDLILHGPFTDETGFRMGNQLLQMTSPPTAIVVGSVQSALGVMRAVRVAGLAVGQDVSIVAHDDVLPYIRPESLVPSLTTTRSSLRAAGVRLSEMLVDLINGRRVEDLAEIWPVEFLLRESTAPVRSA